MSYKVDRVRENMWKMNFFFRSEKSQGNLLHFRETCKGLKKSGNWKINGLGSVKNLHSFCSREKEVGSREIDQVHFPH